MENQGLNPDNQLVTINTDWNNNTLTTQYGSKYQYLVEQGKVYYAASQTATTWSVALNAALQALYPTKYIDIYSDFNGGSGLLKYELSSGDGTHLSAQCQTQVASSLLTASPSSFL